MTKCRPVQGFLARKNRKPGLDCVEFWFVSCFDEPNIVTKQDRAGVDVSKAWSSRADMADRPSDVNASNNRAIHAARNHKKHPPLSGGTGRVHKPLQISPDPTPVHDDDDGCWALVPTPDAEIKVWTQRRVRRCVRHHATERGQVVDATAAHRDRGATCVRLRRDKPQGIVDISHRHVKDCRLHCDSAKCVRHYALRKKERGVFS